MKLYLIPKGGNGLPLHTTATVEECMKSYDKIVGELYTEEEVIALIRRFNYDLVNSNIETFKEWFDEHKKQTR